MNNVAYRIYWVFVFLLVFTTVKGVGTLGAQTPVAKFEIPDKRCVGDSIRFTNTSENYDSTKVKWNFGDVPHPESRKDNPFRIYSEPGTYTVSLVVRDSLGEQPDSISKEVPVNDSPEPEFDYSEDDLTIYEGDELTIELQSNYDTILWSTDARTQKIIVSEDKEGEYKYWVTVTDELGCKATATTEEIVVKPFIPEEENTITVQNNIITVNGDRYNEELEIKNLDGYANPVILTIYNVWGVKVYETSDYQNDWDASDVDAGTYYYHIRSEGRQGVTGYVDVVK